MGCGVEAAGGVPMGLGTLSRRLVRGAGATGQYLEKGYGRLGSSLRGAAVMNPTSNHEDVGSIPGLAKSIKDLVLL